MNPWLLVPVKSFADGKSRLRGTIADPTRIALNEYFLRELLVTASRFPGLDRTAVVADDRRVLELASAAGAHAIGQRRAVGLNEALAEGADRLARLGARRVIVVACDLPELGVDDLRELARLAADERDVAIVADRHGSGTNALVFDAAAPPPFRFGEASFDAHRRAAEAAGLRPRPHTNPALARDIDTQDDLAAWLRASGAPVVGGDLDAAVQRLLARATARPGVSALGAGHRRNRDERGLDVRDAREEFPRRELDGEVATTAAAQRDRHQGHALVDDQFDTGGRR